MPLHANLKINEKFISGVHISRMKTNNDGVNEYAVIITEQPKRVNGEAYDPDWGDYLNEGVMFYHDEEDGAVVCLSKAIQAWLIVNDSRLE